MVWEDFNTTSNVHSIMIKGFSNDTTSLKGEEKLIFLQEKNRFFSDLKNLILVRLCKPSLSASRATSYTLIVDQCFLENSTCSTSFDSKFNKAKSTSLLETSDTKHHFFALFLLFYFRNHNPSIAFSFSGETFGIVFQFNFGINISIFNSITNSKIHSTSISDAFPGE